MDLTKYSKHQNENEKINKLEKCQKIVQSMKILSNS